MLVNEDFPRHINDEIWTDGSAVGGTTISLRGVISIRLRYQIRVDINLNGAVRVVNTARKVAVAFDASGNRAALIHPKGRVLKTDRNTIEIVSNHVAGEDTYYAKISPKELYREELMTGNKTSFCHIVSPSEFYLTTDVELIEKIAEAVNSHCQQAYFIVVAKYATKVVAHSIVGDYCFAFINDTRRWQRVEVLDWKWDDGDSEEVTIQSVDFGYKYQASFRHLRPMNATFAEYPQATHKCCLAELYPPNSKPHTTKLPFDWPAESTEFFMELSKTYDRYSHPFRVIYCYKESGIYHVDLLDETKPSLHDNAHTLSEELILNELALQPTSEKEDTPKVGDDSQNEDVRDFEKVIEELTLDVPDTLSQAVAGYDAKDEARICPFTKPNGTCYKGANCHLEHSLLPADGWTTDKMQVYYKAFVDFNVPNVGEIITVSVTHAVTCCHFYAHIIRRPAELGILLLQVFSPCRILLLTAKVPTKIDCHFHYLEIQALESKRGNQLSLTINDKTYSFLTGDDSTCSAEVDNMISALNNAIRNIFPTVPLQHIIKKIDVIPNTRLQQLRDLEAIASSRREVGPCGGFSTQYACMCDFHGMAYREEVAWDVDNIYVSLNTRELCLKDFDYLDQKDLIPIISALEYNTWFTRLRANQVKLSHDNIDRILHVVRKSLNLEEIYLDNLGLKADFVNKFANVLKMNAATALHTIDLSHNTIEDKGATYLSGCVSKLNKGLVHLNLAHCGLSSKGVNHLASALNSNSSMLTTLNYLNLSGNSLKDDIGHLHTFLSHSNALQHIDISCTDIILESLFGALVRGCTTNLVHLNISRNPFSSKKSKEAPISFKQFFSTTLNLKYLNMSHCKLPQEALKNLLLGLACNEFTKEMSLDISNNGLGSQGAHVLESCVHGVRCISSLDISDNNMDGDLANVVIAISKNKSLRHLNMGRSMKKHMALIMDAVVQILQDDECLLQSLIIPDCRLRSDMFNLLNALGDNKSLETLDISGNSIGDSGARLLAKALQINNKLRTIIFDRNNITLQGYHDIAYALESNRTVQYMPFPIFDITPCMKASAERTDVTMKKIQDLLNRNVTLRRNSLKTLPLQPGFLLTSKQQALERLVTQTQDAIKNLASESIASNNDINHATGVIQDAENSKQLLVRLQEVAQHRDDRDGHPVETKLQQAACDVHNSICDYLQTTTDKMLKCCKDQCPYVLHDDQTVQDIKKGCKNKKPIPLDFVTACIKQQAGVDIMNRVRELNLMVAAQLSEQITDEVYDSLMRSYKILVGDASAIRIDSPPRRSRLSSSGSSRHGASDISITDSSHQSDHSPMATPHLSIKRKSMHGRKLRPKSVVDSVEGLSADDIPSLLPSSNRNSEEDDSVTELPSATHQLQHLVKGRPRRAKTRAPTRPLVKPPDVTDSVSQDLVEGLDTFFRPGSVTPTSDDCHSFQADGSPNHDFASPTLSDDRKTPKLSRNSPLLRGLMTPTPRSRSTDNLEKFSPSFGRKTGGNDCSSSPLTRRFTGESLLSHESSEGSIAGEVNIPMEQSSHSETDEADIFKQMKPKTAPSVAPKPRPWSMVNSEGKSSDLSLLSDGSSPNNSTGNTPDSAETLDSSESSLLDKRVVKDIKLKRGGILQNYLPERGDFKFLARYKATSENQDQPSNNTVTRRDNNYNCRETEDAHIGR